MWRLKLQHTHRFQFWLNVRRRKFANKVLADPAPTTEATPPACQQNVERSTGTVHQHESKNQSLPSIKSNPILEMESADALAQADLIAKSIPFDEVPGPTLLKRMAKMWGYIPVLSGQITANSIQYLLSAADVMRMSGRFSVRLVSTPNLFLPTRANCIGFGPEWEQLRKTIEIPLHECVHHHHAKVENACDKFVARLPHLRNRQDEVSTNFIDEIHKWNIECLFTVMVDRTIEWLTSTTSDAPHSEQQKLLDALNGATKAIKKCEYGLHLWRFIETPAWRSLTRHCDTIDTILCKYIHRAQTSLQLKKNEQDVVPVEKVSLMEHLLLKENMLSEDIHTIFLDMLLIGMNTVTHTIAFLLYHLARYPRAQRLLHAELLDMRSMTRDSLTGCTYLQACIKESLRLKPPMPILSRVLTKDVAINHFRIPKGTYVLIATYLTSLREEHFEDALKFKPERWLEGDDGVDMSQLMASVPYGYGPKACLGKELAELQVGMLISKIIRKFRVEYHYGDINSDNRLLSAPDRPLRFKFLER